MRRIGYDSWGALLIIAVVLVVGLTVDLAPAPTPAPVGTSASGPVGLVAAIESSPGLATFFGALMGSTIGLLAILAGAMFNARLNRRQHDRERDEDRRALAAALYGEILWGGPYLDNGPGLGDSRCVWRARLASRRCSCRSGPGGY